MSSKTTTVKEIQKFSVTIAEFEEMLIHQMTQVITLGPKYQGKIFFLEGEPGIGKTQIQAQILAKVCKLVEKMGPEEVFDKTDFQYFKEKQDCKGRLETQNLSARDSGDFSGLPYNVLDMDFHYGKELSAEEKKQIAFDQKMITKFSRPEFLPSKGYGILFWDEGNRVFDLSLKTILLSMWMDRGVNGHYLGAGYVQVVAGNPFNDPRFTTDKLDEAQKGRIAVVTLNPTVEETIQYLTSVHKEHFLIDYLTENPTFCNIAKGANRENSFSPRDIEKCMLITHTIKKDYKKQGKEKLLSNLLAVNFGIIEAKKIMSFLEDVKEISLEQILKNPKLIKRIKASDMPVNKKLADEIFYYLEPKIMKDQEIEESIGNTIGDILEVLNWESKGAMMNQITNGDQEDVIKRVEGYNKIIKDKNPFSEVKKHWSTQTYVKKEG